MHMLGTYRIDTALVILLLSVLGAYGLGYTVPTFLVGVAVVGLLPVVWGVIRSFREREWISMDVLASIALVFSVVGGEWVSAIFIELMLAAARILDDATRDRTEKSIRGLLDLRPNTARVRAGGEVRTVPVSDVRVGDMLLASIGERISVDGTVEVGTAAIDTSSLTGESLPVDVGPGDEVVSGTVVRSGGITIAATRVGKETTLERVIALVQSARAEKPGIQTLGERFGKIYIVSMFIVATTLLITTHNVALVLSVVLVVCADDIAVAIPIAYLRAMYDAARHGVVIKGGKYLEALGTMRTIVVDKTGTLTTGVLTVTDVIAAEGFSDVETLRYAAYAATHSQHPLARATVAHVRRMGGAETYADESVEYGGKGVVARHKGQRIVFGRDTLLTEMGIAIPESFAAQVRTARDAGKSVSYVAVDARVAGCVCVEDRIKENAAEAIRALRAAGVRRVVMLTGDNEHVAARVAKELGIDEWHAGLLPEDKVAIVRTLQAQEPVVMVGDGVNDAAALSLAGIGIAMGGLGAAGTIESAQIVLMRDDLSVLPRIMSLARTVRRISFQDFGIWGATNVIGLTLVFTGFIGPAGAAAYNFITDFFPLINAARARMRP